MIRTQDDTEFSTAGDQRIEHRTGLIGHRKQFTGLLPLELDSERCKPLDGLPHRKGRQHVAHEVARAEKIVQGQYVVRDVAASPAGDQDLGSDGFGAIQQLDSQSRDSALPQKYRLPVRPPPPRLHIDQPMPLSSPLMSTPGLSPPNDARCKQAVQSQTLPWKRVVSLCQDRRIASPFADSV